MPLTNDDQPTDMVRTRKVLFSRGRSPMGFIDDELPTLPVIIYGVGGPGKAPSGPRVGGGTNPWNAGSFTIGTNHQYVLRLVDLSTSTPNVWVFLRHNHSGTSAIPGGTVAGWHMPARGDLSRVGGDKGLLVIRGGGTITALVFGAGSTATTYRAVGTSRADRVSVRLEGHIV